MHISEVSVEGESESDAPGRRSRAAWKYSCQTCWLLVPVFDGLIWSERCVMVVTIESLFFV